MEGVFQEKELSAIHQEYQDYFPLCDLVLQQEQNLVRHPGENLHSLTTQQQSQQHPKYNGIKIQTDEGKNIIASVELRGWFDNTVNESNSRKYYQTFEALLSDKSPGFRSRFAGALDKKLENLQKQ